MSLYRVEKIRFSWKCNDKRIIFDGLAQGFSEMWNLVWYWSNSQHSVSKCFTVRSTPQDWHTGGSSYVIKKPCAILVCSMRLWLSRVSSLRGMFKFCKRPVYFLIFHLTFCSARSMYFAIYNLLC